MCYSGETGIKFSTLEHGINLLEKKSKMTRTENIIRKHEAKHVEISFPMTKFRI